MKKDGFKKGVSYFIGTFVILSVLSVLASVHIMNRRDVIDMMEGMRGEEGRYGIIQSINLSATGFYALAADAMIIIIIGVLIAFGISCLVESRFRRNVKTDTSKYSSFTEKT